MQSDAACCFYARFDDYTIDGKPGKPLGSLALDRPDTDIMAAVCDGREKQVSGSTVVRDFHLLSAVFNRGVKEWKWLPFNPLKE